MAPLGPPAGVLALVIDSQARTMPPKRGKRPAEGAPVILCSDSDQEEVLEWLRCTAKLPRDMVDKVSSMRGPRHASNPALSCLRVQARVLVRPRASQAAIVVAWMPAPGTARRACSLC